MADNIDTSNGRDNVAWIGERKDVWHRKGHQMAAGASIEEWAIASGLGYEVASAPASMEINGIHVPVEGYRHLYRKDTGAELGYVTNVYKELQPIDPLNWLNDLIKDDDRFQLDVAGALRGGRIVWATAKFVEPMNVAGDKHVARLLMSTSFDGTYATDNRATMTRVVCNNMLDAALARGGKAAVRTRHNSKWKAEKVNAQLGNIIQQFADYKAMGDAMVKQAVAFQERQTFFKKLLKMDDAKEDSTRKANQLNELNHAYDQTVAEGTDPNTAWCALNAVTRYVDHSKSTRDTGYGETESRFFSAQFTTGAAMKAQAVGMLYDMSEGELLRAVVAETERNKDINEMLRRPLRVS